MEWFLNLSELTFSYLPKGKKKVMIKWPPAKVILCRFNEIK